MRGNMPGMTYDEFKRQLGKAGVTAREFAELLKLNPSSVTNYAKQGAVPNHLAVIVTLMGEMAEHRINFRTVISRIDIEPNKPRGSQAVGRFAKAESIERHQ